MSDNLLAKPVGKLLIIDRDGPGFISCILDKERVTFGRNSDCHIRIPSLSVSRVSATFEFDDFSNTTWILNHGMNLITVDDVELVSGGDGIELEHGAVIKMQVGDVMRTMIYQLIDPPTSTINAQATPRPAPPQDIDAAINTSASKGATLAPPLDEEGAFSPVAAEKTVRFDTPARGTPEGVCDATMALNTTAAASPAVHIAADSTMAFAQWAMGNQANDDAMMDECEQTVQVSTPTVLHTSATPVSRGSPRLVIAAASSPSRATPFYAASPRSSTPNTVPVIGQCTAARSTRGKSRLANTSFVGDEPMEMANEFQATLDVAIEAAMRMGDVVTGDLNVAEMRAIQLMVQNAVGAVMQAHAAQCVEEQDAAMDDAPVEEEMQAPEQQSPRYAPATAATPAAAHASLIDDLFGDSDDDDDVKAPTVEAKSTDKARPSKEDDLFGDFDSEEEEEGDVKAPVVEQQPKEDDLFGDFDSANEQHKAVEDCGAMMAPMQEAPEAMEHDSAPQTVNIFGDLDNLLHAERSHDTAGARPETPHAAFDAAIDAFFGQGREPTDLETALQAARAMREAACTFRGCMEELQEENRRLKLELMAMNALLKAADLDDAAGSDYKPSPQPASELWATDEELPVSTRTATPNSAVAIIRRGRQAGASPASVAPRAGAAASTPLPPPPPTNLLASTAKGPALPPPPSITRSSTRALVNATPVQAAVQDEYTDLHQSVVKFGFTPQDGHTLIHNFMASANDPMPRLDRTLLDDEGMSYQDQPGLSPPSRLVRGMASHFGYPAPAYFNLYTAARDAAAAGFMPGVNAAAAEMEPQQPGGVSTILDIEMVDAPAVVEPNKPCFSTPIACFTPTHETYPGPDVLMHFADIALVDGPRIFPDTDCEAVDTAAGEADACLVCRVVEAGETLLVCDGCDGYEHIHCAGLSEVPEGDWFCANCKTSKAPAEVVDAAPVAPVAARKRRSPRGAAKPAAAPKAAAGGRRGGEGKGAPEEVGPEAAQEQGQAASTRRTRRGACPAPKEGAAAAPAASEPKASGRSRRTTKRQQEEELPAPPKRARRGGSAEAEALSDATNKAPTRGRKAAGAPAAQPTRRSTRARR